MQFIICSVQCVEFSMLCKVCCAQCDVCQLCSVQCKVCCVYGVQSAVCSVPCEVPHEVCRVLFEACSVRCAVSSA